MLRESQRIAGLGSYVLDIVSGHWRSSDVLDEVFGIDSDYDRSVAGWTALIHPADRPIMVDHFSREVLGLGEPFNKEYRMRSQGRIMQLFVESLEVIFAPLTFQLAQQEQPSDRSQFSIATRTSSYGDLAPTAAEPLSHETQTILHNASQMLAVILERLDFEQKIQTDKSSVEQLADERLHTLQATVDELRLSQNATINLVEDLSIEIAQRKRAEAEIHRLNQTLESRVVERTSQLAAANAELAAFSYSVSHDLRAPLRAIDGFSAALMEDCADRFDEASLDHLRRVRAGSQRMAVLIDDLLILSRETRAEMRRERVDVTALAREIGADLQRAQPDHRPEWSVASGLTANADLRMLRVVLTNLLGNAWKFTQRGAGAKIEVSVLPAEEVMGKLPTGLVEPDGTVFYVRDNGAGFDMAYAGKLFGAFQRLHSQNEFEGTGIGLALAQRIIRRHGGHVWAEGKINKGATFYFTLGTNRS